VRGAVGAFINVTDRKHLEDLLRERADLLELATEAIIVREMNGALLFWNSGAETLYGWRREEVLGKSIHQVLQTRFPKGLSDVENSLAQTGKWSGNLTQFTRDGKEVTVACRKALKAGGNAILEMNRDITAQLKAEDALRKTERLAAMGRVAGIIAHEINNPLEAITSAFYLLRDHPSLDEEARYLAKLGEEEIRRVAHITRQTLGFYREAKHPVQVYFLHFDEILELQSRRMEFNNISLNKQYRSKGTIWGFPVELKQVFLNLIGNAVQAMPNGVEHCVCTFSNLRGRAINVQKSAFHLRYRYCIDPSMQNISSNLFHNEINEGYRPGPLDQQRHCPEIRRNNSLPKHVTYGPEYHLFSSEAT
jgi:PAS domain S-box-containing protein